MKPQNPNSFASTLPSLHRSWIQSTQETLDGNVDMGTPTGNAPVSTGINSGVYTQFSKGNSSGVLIRIAATGVSDTGAAYNWTAPNVGVAINHGLKRKPIGFKVVDIDGVGQVYRTAAPDENQITLAITDDTKSVTVYVF